MSEKDYIEEKVEKFEDDFREYLNASIAFAEIQEPYQPLSSEDEIEWLKNYVKKLLQKSWNQ